MTRHHSPKTALAQSANSSLTQIYTKFKMNPLSGGVGRQTFRLVMRFSAYVAILTTITAPQVMGQLAHRYSFTADANDSIAGANGTVIDAGVNPNFSFTGGALDFSANNGNTSNAITEDAYLNLPNGIVSAAATNGMNGALAFEWWYTLAQSRTWQRVGDFGNSNDGEDTSNLGSASDYLSIVATSGRGNQVDMTNHTTTGFEPAIGLAGTATLGTPYHVMAVYNHNDHSAFTPQGSNGTMTLYVNGARVGTAGVHPDIDIRTFADVNNWLGRSQWPDPLFDGSYDEFRIYHTAPNDAYVTASFAAGPNSLATFTPWVEEFDLSLVVDRDTGTMTLMNSAAGSINVSDISIASASGAIDPTKWVSISDGNFPTFDPDGTWAETSATPALIREAEILGTGGGAFGTGGTLSSLQLGNAGAWTLSTYEDLVVNVIRVNPDFSTTTIPVFVDYIGGLGERAVRADLNFDGVVDIDDWIEFASHHLEDISGLTVAQASLLGDLDADLDNDYNDFLIFQGDYDAANGLGAFAALLAGGGVPEPSTAALMLIVGCATLVTRGR